MLKQSYLHLVFNPCLFIASKVKPVMEMFPYNTIKAYYLPREVQSITIRAHYITDNPSGYRGRLFPLDNSAFSLSLSSLFAFDANEYSAEDTEEKRVQL